jgi:hypothetical protein
MGIKKRKGNKEELNPNLFAPLALKPEECECI